MVHYEVPFLALNGSVVQEGYQLTIFTTELTFRGRFMTERWTGVCPRFGHSLVGLHIFAARITTLFPRVGGTSEHIAQHFLVLCPQLWRRQ